MHGARDFDDGSDSGRIVHCTVIDFVAVDRLADAEVIEMRADDYELVFQFWVVSGQHTRLFEWIVRGGETAGLPRVVDGYVQAQAAESPAATAARVRDLSGGLLLE